MTLIDMLKANVIVGDFTLASGAKSRYYVDARRVTLSPRGLRMVGGKIVDILRKYPTVRAVGGPTIGADPIVGAILTLSAAYNGFLVRKTPKQHGTRRLVEGVVPPIGSVAIVDDVVTTGGSLVAAIDAVDRPVSCVVVVLDRLEGASEAIQGRGIPFYALATVKDLDI